MPKQTTGFPGGIDFGDPADYRAVLMPGVCAQQTLRMSGDTIAEQGVTIGSETFRTAVVNTDSTKDTVGNDLNHLEAECRITMLAHGLIGGDLIRVESEIMVVTGVPDANHIIVKRGVSNTAIAAHAAATSIFKEATAGAGDIAVGVVTTLTPTVYTAALVADINNRSKQNIGAEVLDVNTVLVYTADGPGGDPVPYGTTIAVSEDLTNGAWDAANMTRGIGSKIPTIVEIVPTAAEVSAGSIVVKLPFTATAVLGVFMKTTSTGVIASYDGGRTVSGNKLTLTNAGSSDFATTHTITAFVV